MRSACAGQSGVRLLSARAVRCMGKFRSVNSRYPAMRERPARPSVGREDNPVGRNRMVFLRTARRWWTAKATYAARAVAPALPLRVVDLIERGLARTGPALPILSRMVARNMRLAGVYSETAFRGYFEQVALHFSNAMRVFRLAGKEDALEALARERIDVDTSIAHLHAALEHGRGAIVAPPHVCNYLLTLARLNQEVPVCVYLRWSDDRRKRDIKRQWCEATGLEVILEPASASDPASRAAACVEALRSGKVLVMTPDIAQRRDKGIAVRLLGRQVYLPSGPASIAMLAEAPLVPVFGRMVGGVHMIRAEAPVFVEGLARTDGGRSVALQRALQAWAGSFEAFLRACPEAWFLWADNRWTRVWRGDPRYSAGLRPPVSETPAVLGGIGETA